MRSMKRMAATLAIAAAAAAPSVIQAQEARVLREVERAQRQAEMALIRAERPMMQATRLRLAVARPALAQARMATGLARPRLAEARAVPSDEPPEAWLQEDPAGPLYQSAREALNRRRYDEAAEMFARIRSEHPRSGYVPDSYYWQAFALQREGGQRNLRRAAELLQVQGAEHADANTRADARALMVRIEAQLASRGDADAAEAIARQAAGPCDEEQEVRLAALSALMNMNADQAVPILREVLQSRGECSVELRRRGVFLIAQHMTDESVDILLDLAHRNPDPDREVREQAVFWLHQVDTPEALDALQAILRESDDEKLQERAIFAISQRSDARSVEVLKEYAERSDVPRELRENAIFWISQNPSAGGARYLIDLYGRLDDDDLRERAIFGVAQTSSEEGRRWLLERARDRSESIDVRKNALFWAGQMGSLRADELRDIFASLDEREMKEQVIFVASQMRDPGAVDFLMEVASSEENEEVRKRAIFWLGQSKDPRVAEFLLTLMRGGSVAR